MNDLNKFISVLALLGYMARASVFVLDSQHILHTKGERGGPEDKFLFDSKLTCVLDDDGTPNMAEFWTTFVKNVFDECIIAGECW